jgi:hypothetical protein
MVNGPRDDIPGRQLGPRVKMWHEPFAIFEVQRSPFTP